jgi:alpha-tubulin suppressor-like RCC1 family protein
MTQLSFRTSLTRRWLVGGHRASSPVRISSETNWLAVAGGMLSSFALKRDGTLWAWGGNWTGQLGNGSGRLTEFNPPIEKLPQMAGLNRIGQDTDWVRLSAGSEHVLAQKRDGTLWSWGRNDCGQLGVGTYVSTKRPIPISAETNWLMFAAAGAGQRGAWSAAIKQDGTLWVWGNWKRLKLPNGRPTPTDTNIVPRPLQLGTETTWVRVACGNEAGAALKADGTLWTWGSDTFLAAGITPRQQGTDNDWSDVSIDGLGLGTESAIHALKRDGTLWTWHPLILGSNATAQAPPF